MGRFLELVRSRRSIRRYKPDPIDPAVLTRILEAGSIAPSGNNTQPWRFIVVRDREMKERLCDVSGKQPWYSVLSSSGIRAACQSWQLTTSGRSSR